jgi:glycosyltransferase involved in cell wall biosynthesis
MSSILFWDPSCNRPYDSQTLRHEAMGGTESSVVRIADALRAHVVQHNRIETSGRYHPPSRIDGISHVVLLRDSRALPTVQALYPDARHCLWVHDQIQAGSTRGRRLASTATALCEMHVAIICVSDTQRKAVDATLRGIGIADQVRTHTIYNPVEVAMTEHRPLDRDKLVFFSSPNKGLAYTLDAFRALRSQLPDLRLLVGNPGYKDARSTDVEGVEWLGAQPQARIHAEVSTALCTFCPNFVIPETFGLVFAESLALGTPVLAHDCGAASEVIGDPSQVLPVSRWQRNYERAFGKLSPRWRRQPARIAARFGMFDAYIDRISAWRDGARPEVGPDPRFAIATVAAQWRALMDSLA